MMEEAEKLNGAPCDINPNPVIFNSYTTVSFIACQVFKTRKLFWTLNL